MNDTYLMFVGIENGIQSNKYYNMIPSGNIFTAKYGRVGQRESTKTYPISKWYSVYNSKLRKGYTDITDFKRSTTIVQSSSSNQIFDEFYDRFKTYTRTSVQSNYISEGCTQKQIDEAQNVLNGIINNNFLTIDDINKRLLEIYRIIPRRMDDVRSYLVYNKSDVKSIVAREQDALDSMDSVNITHTTDPLKDLDIIFEEGDQYDIDIINDLLSATNSSHYRIHKVYRIVNPRTRKSFDDFLSKTKNKQCEYLIHGTRNPNVLSILKSGLLIRPTNAAVISGAAYGNGVYHSAHTDKSLGYTGRDNDCIFFIQNVNMGNPYIYEGWYSKGKDLDRSNMNYNYLSKNGYDSLYVKPGDGLRNSEYVVYNAEQTDTSYLVWMK